MNPDCCSTYARRPDRTWPFYAAPYSLPGGTIALFSLQIIGWPSARPSPVHRALMFQPGIPYVLVIDKTSAHCHSTLIPSRGVA